MLTKEEVQHIAKLARIRLSEEEIDKFTKDLSRILDYVEDLKEVDTEAVEPIAHITGLENAMRKDTLRKEKAKRNLRKLFTEQFPRTSGDYLKVPQVLGDVE